MPGFIKIYTALGRQLLTALILIVLLNLAAEAVLYYIKPRPLNPLSSAYGDSVYAYYPDMQRSEVDLLLQEMWSRWYAFEPYVQFREAEFKGRYVNVNSAGFREVNGQGPWPPSADNYNVLIFGGSTVFGYGVRDDQTIAAYLQTEINSPPGKKPVKVYNFACSRFISTQEMLLFQNILRSGIVPDLALFIDGLNDTGNLDGQPDFSPEIKFLLENSKGQSLAPIFGSWLHRQPLIRLLSGEGGDSDESGEPAPVKYDLVNRMIGRYLENKRQIEAIAAAYRVPVLFSWQPIPFYHCPAGAYGFRDRPVPMQNYHEAAYSAMAELRRQGQLGSNLAWLADLQEGRQEMLYVDRVHYSPAFSKIIAVALGERVAAARGDGSL